MAPGAVLQFELAELSLIGAREENQDRIATAIDGGTALVAVFDGMGGHSDGAKAAELARQTLLARFGNAPHPMLDPLAFLHIALGAAHSEMVAIGAQLPLEHRPRATGAACLVQDGTAWWIHVGDSRIYHLRDGQVVNRTRDHSHVELLLREGLIAESEMRGHPMRNFVECCLGGDSPLPDMSITARHTLSPGDVLLVCTDGLWSGLEDADLAEIARDERTPIEAVVRTLAERAVAKNAPHSDNTSITAVRWNGN